MRINEVIKRLPSSNVAIKNNASTTPKDGWFPAYSATGQDVWLPDFRFNQKGIVVSAVGARCGKAFKADGRWNICANTHPLAVDESKALRDYCWYMINSEDWWIKGGTAQPFVKIKDSLNREYDFPSLTRQKEIVDKLDRIQLLIDQKKRQTQDFDDLIKARFIEMFGDALFETRPFKDVCDELFAGGDIKKDRTVKNADYKHPYAVFTNGEKNNGLYGYTDVARVTKPSITISGRGTIGFCSIRTDPFYPAVRLIVATPKEGFVTPLYLKHFIDSKNYGGSGTSIPQLTQQTCDEKLLRLFDLRSHNA